MRMLNRTPLTVTGVAGAIVLVSTSAAVATPAARSSDGPSSDRVLASGVGAPFQIALRKGTVYYADGGAGTISKVTPKGAKVVRKVPGVAGVEFSPDGATMAIASGGPGGPRQRVTLVRGHRKPVVSDLLRYEQRVNPDRNVTYGVVAGGNSTCNQALAGLTGGSATYKGAVDSHPYQLAPLPGGAFAVAEAGGNAILRVSRKGAISTIALLPPQRLRFTQAQANAIGVPSCAGVTYAFEPVPTDVERGPRGSLLVTTLPGGPESPALGARGSVYRISKRGAVSRVATGFLGATNLSLVKGRVYVSELFAGRITRFGKGGRRTAMKIASPVSVEATRTKLYVGTLGTGPKAPGKVVRIPR